MSTPLGSTHFSLQAIPVTATYSMGVANLNQLNQVGLRDPRQLEKSLSKDAMAADGILSDARALRETIQRTFNAARLRNAEDFAAYLDNLVGESVLGGSPCITLYASTDKAVSEEGMLYIPYGTPMIAIDGETQLAARFSRGIETRSENVPFVIYHGITHEHAKLIAHDLNAKGRRISEREVASMNVNGLLTKTITSAVLAASRTLEDINRRGKGLGSKKQPYMATFDNLANLIGGIHYGDARYGFRLDTFMRDFNASTASEFANAQHIEQSVAAMFAVPRETRRTMSDRTWRMAGVLVSRHGPQTLTAERVSLLVTNDKAHKGRQVDARYAAVLGGM